MHKIIHFPKSVLEKKRGWNDTNLNNLFFQEVKIPNGKEIELQQVLRSCGLSSPRASNVCNASPGRKTTAGMPSLGTYIMPRSYVSTTFAPLSGGSLNGRWLDLRSLSSGCKILNSHNVTGWRFSIWGNFLFNRWALQQFHSLFFFTSMN
jgi:hypothetical protein